MFCWKIIEVFIEKQVTELNSLHKECNPRSLVENFHPSQLEKRFGGEAEAPTQFWPPVISSDEFNEESIIHSILEQ